MGQHANVPSQLSVSGQPHILNKGRIGRPFKYPHLLAALNGLREHIPKPVERGGVLHPGSQLAAVAESDTTGQRANRDAYERAQAVQVVGESSMGQQLAGKRGRSKMPKEVRNERQKLQMRKKREDKAKRLYEYSLRNLKRQEIRSTNPALYAKRVEAKSKRQRDWRRKQKAKAQEEAERAERAERESAHGQQYASDLNLPHTSSPPPPPHRAPL